MLVVRKGETRSLDGSAVLIQKRQLAVGFQHTLITNITSDGRVIFVDTTPDSAAPRPQPSRLVTAPV